MRDMYREPAWGWAFAFMAILIVAANVTTLLMA